MNKLKNAAFFCALTLLIYGGITVFAAQKTDLNSDGNLSNSDIELIRQELLEKNYESLSTDAGYDVNGDGKTDAVDYVFLKQTYNAEKSETMKNEAKKYGIEYERDGRRLVFYDEFDGDTLDASKWYFYGSMSSGDRWYTNDSERVYFEDGSLVMKAELVGENGDTIAMPEGLSTKTTMNFRYGYAEMRAKIAYRHGAWPSWWMLGLTPYRRSECWTEIDIFEVFESDNTATANLHKWSDEQKNHSNLSPNSRDIPCSYVFDESINPNDDYHIYGFLWTENEISCFLDGEKYFTYDITEDWDEYNYSLHSSLIGMDAFHDYSYLIFNDELYSDASHTGEDGIAKSEDFPIYYEIDYVRLWQNEATDGIHFGDEIAVKTAEIGE